jgi:P27 family predicted phage terminase small subunit
MAVGGRKPVPAEIREMTGLKSSHPPANPRPPKNKRPLGGPPSWMTQLQKEIWREGIASAPASILREIDASVYQVWVFAAYSARRASEAFEAEGGQMVEFTATGTRKPNPYLAIIRQENIVMLRAAAELGFTPSAKMRVKPDGRDKDNEPQNPFNAFQQDKGKKPN